MRKFNRKDVISINHQPYRTVIDNKRYYTVDGEVLHPSITTVLGSTAENKFEEFIQKVGQEEFEKISNRAASRGTALHGIIENIINGKEIEVSPFDLQIYRTVNVVLEHVDNILAVEQMLISDNLRIGGTVDCIAEFQNELSIIDWKTSRRKKEKSEIEDYFLQATFYSLAFEEMTGIHVPRLCIIIFSDHEKPQVFLEHRDNFIGKLKSRREMYNDL
jgi:ATP-dependent exoDNAse (exonuclease V) beta subunit